MKTISLQLVAVIDGKMIPIKTAEYSESIAQAIKEGNCDDTETAIVEYLADVFYDGDSGL